MKSGKYKFIKELIYLIEKEFIFQNTKYSQIEMAWTVIVIVYNEHYLPFITSVKYFTQLKRKVSPKKEDSA